MIMLKKIVIGFLLIMLVGNPFSTGKINSIEKEVHQSLENDEVLKVVASISIVADYTAQVGKGLLSVESIVSGNENPHIYEPTTSEIEMVANADLFVRMGLDGLEPWVQNVLDVNPGLNVLELVNPATMMEYDPIIDAPNPHVWMSPNISKVMVEKIYDEIATLDPSNNNTYTTNKNNYLVELDNLLERINSSRTQFEGMKVIVHHPAFIPSNCVRELLIRSSRLSSSTR
jgi:ABC-type Zn uptake system ZnuABC Zn-binding protein ZnuA